MIKSIDFVDSEYSNFYVAGRSVREKALENIDISKILSKNSKANLHILLRTDIIGLDSEDIIEISKLVQFFPSCVICDDYAMMIISKKPFPQSDDKMDQFTHIAETSDIVKIDSVGWQIVEDMQDVANLHDEVYSDLVDEALSQGVHIYDQSSTFLWHDTKYGKGVVIEPNVYIGPGVKIGDNVTIKAFSYIEGAEIKDRATIGPYARIRGETVIGEGSKIGNFVEVKNSALKPGVKAGHLSYIGDSQIGDRVNIGAGVVTCNYDGKNKHKTIIGNDAFIGTNSSLIAPLEIGKNSLVGAGSFINSDVPDNSFTKGRSKQEIRDKK